MRTLNDIMSVPNVFPSSVPPRGIAFTIVIGLNVLSVGEGLNVYRAFVLLVDHTFVWLESCL